MGSFELPPQTQFETRFFHAVLSNKAPIAGSLLAFCLLMFLDLRVWKSLCSLLYFLLLFAHMLIISARALLKITTPHDFFASPI